MDLQFATSQDLDEILSLYRSVLGKNGCTWTEQYPCREIAEEDLAAQSLYVLREGARIVGTVSVVPENELDDLPFWTVPGAESCEIARIVIAPAEQGRGLAYQMLTALWDALRAQGKTYRAAHLLVSPGNPAALHTYERLGFQKRGECEEYSQFWYAYELCFGEKT